MSGVDVLAVMQRCQNQANITARRHGGPFLRQHEMDVSEARAAVAELIEADQAYDDARRKWSGEKYEGDDYGVLGSDFIRCLCCEGESGAGILNRGVTHEPDCEVAAIECAESRRYAALRRVKGESE